VSLTISAGTLGSLAMPDFFFFFFWIKLKCDRIPFEIPKLGVFSSIDSYIKGTVLRYYEQEGGLPGWFPYIGEVQGIEPVPSYQKFSVTEPQSGAILRGTPDGVFRLKDGSFHIVDYKTARFTVTQSGLFPMYEVQLNAYAYIANRTFFSPVSSISLIYLEPDTNLASNPDLLSRSKDCLMLGFTPKVRSVEIKPDSFIEGLLKQASQLSMQGMPPQHNPTCRDCESLEKLFELVTGGV